MKILAHSLLAASMLASLKAAAGQTPPMPIVPIASTMHHWDNHWYIWLPQDDRFEAVEVMSINRGPGGQPLVWVFFTERAGSKRQVHYVNSAAMARSQGWHHVPISYSVNGAEGKPRGVDVQLTDVDRQAVSIHLSVDGARPLTAAGLTNQSGHSADSIMLMFFRGENTSATDWHVRINGADVSTKGAAYVAPFIPAYSRDISTALFPFGKLTANFGNAEPAAAAGLRFRRLAGSSYVAQTAGRTRKLLEVDDAGGLRSYIDEDDSHALRIDFARPLPAPCRSTVPANVPFSIAIDGRKALLTGSVEYQPSQSSSLRWRFDTPAWATNRHLTTAANVDCGLGTQAVVVAPQLVTRSAQ